MTWWLDTSLWQERLLATGSALLCLKLRSLEGDGVLLIKTMAGELQRIGLNAEGVAFPALS